MSPLADLTADRWHDLRCALAGNPALPAALIDHLAGLGDDAIGRELATRQDLNKEQISHLVRGGGTQTIVRLLERGALRPSEVDRFDEEAVVAMAEIGDVPIEWAWRAATDADAGMRRDLASTRYLPKKIVEALANDPDLDVVGGAARSPNLTESLAARLAAHPHMTVRRALACNVTAPAHLLAALAQRRVPPASLCVACDGSGHWLEEEWSCDGTHEEAWHHVDSLLALNPATPGVTAGRFASHPWMNVRWGLAKRADLPRDAYRTLAHDPIPGVRADLAANAAIGEELIRLLAGDDGHDVRRSLAHNPVVPLDVLAGLASLAKIGATVLPRIAAATAAEIRELADSPIATLRMLVAQRADLPRDIVDQLAADGDAKVLKSIAANPGLTGGQLRKMVQAHGLRVAARVAANPSCPPELLAQLASQATASHKVLRRIAEHPAAPAEAVLRCLADARGRTLAARHPALPADRLAGLLSDPDDLVAMAAAANPSLPETLMHEIARLDRRELAS